MIPFPAFARIIFWPFGWVRPLPWKAHLLQHRNDIFHIKIIDQLAGLLTISLLFVLLDKELLCAAACVPTAKVKLSASPPTIVAIIFFIYQNPHLKRTKCHTVFSSEHKGPKLYQHATTHASVTDNSGPWRILHLLGTRGDKSARFSMTEALFHALGAHGKETAL